MIEVEDRYKNFGRHEKIRIEQWSKKLWQVTTNAAWKKNRNLYAMLLLDWVLNGRLVKPFTLVPPDSHLPVFNKAEVYSQLSTKFKDFEKNSDSKDVSKSKTPEIDRENQDPQIPRRGIISNSSSGSIIPIEDRLNKYRNNSYAKRHDFINRSAIDRIEEEQYISDNEIKSKSKRHNFDPNIEKLHNHPLYK